MTAHDRKITFGAKPVSSTRKAVRRLDALDAEALAKRLVVFTPRGDEIDALVEAVRRELPGVAHSDIVRRVLAHNPDNLWAIARRDTLSDMPADGLMAFLMLNQDGMVQLVEGTFDASSPPLNLLAAQNEKPAGIYLWALHARGVLHGGVALVMEKINSPLYRDVDIYTRPITAEGLRFVQGTGFRRGATFQGQFAPHLYVMTRSAAARVNVLTSTSPIYDDYKERANSRDLSVTVARTIEDVMRVMTIRSAVYMAEQECPYEEEFDGNDFTATHLIGYVGNEPAACLRIRYFADFVKMERLAIRHEFRKTRLAFKVVKAGIELCRTKGYRKIYGHSQKRLLNFWSRFGFKPYEGSREFVFSDFDYIEVALDMKPHPEAISIGADPYVMIRPEGRWHIPGILERSAIRPVSRPSVDHKRATSNAPTMQP